MRQFPLYLLSLLSLAVLHAEDLTLTDNRILKDVKVMEVGMDFLKVSHEHGISTIKAGDLPELWKEKYQLTQEDILKRREDAQRYRDEAWQRQRKALTESEKHPRYLTAADISKISSAGGVSMNHLEAEMASAKWNSNEAFRTGDKEMYDHYNKQLQSLQPQFAALSVQKINNEAERKREEKERERLNTNLEVQLARYSSIIENQKKENQRLNDSLTEAEKKENRTIINNWSNGGWRWTPSRVVVVPPRPPVVIPPPRPRPILNFEINRGKTSAIPAPVHHPRK